jgi:hypothetical protein
MALREGSDSMTKNLQVILAVKALVQSALPGAKVRGGDGDTSKPERIGPGGCVIVHPGDPGDPEVDLSPPAYNYSHRLFLEVAAADGKGGADLDAMLVPIGEAFAADRTLGGLCEFIVPGAPDRNDRSTDAIATTNWAVVPIDAEYSCSDPLG